MLHLLAKLKHNFYLKVLLKIIFNLLALIIFYGSLTFSIKKSYFFLAPDISYSYFNIFISYLFYYFGLGIYLLPIFFVLLSFGYWLKLFACLGLIFTTQLYATLTKFTMIGGWHNGGGLLGCKYANLFINFFTIEVTYLICFWLTVIFIILIDSYGLSLVHYLCYKLNKSTYFKKYLVKFNLLEKKNLINLIIRLKNISKSIIKLIVKGESEILEKIVSEEYEFTAEIENINSFLSIEPKLKPAKTLTNLNNLNNLEEFYNLPETILLTTREKKISLEPDLIDNLVNKLKLFSINVKCLEVIYGPVVSTYVLEPDADVKLSKILNLEDDIALALEVAAVRIIAPIIGTSYIGLEVPNKVRQIVPFKNIIEDQNFKKFSGNLPLVIGYDTKGKAVIEDLAKLPHLLVAGSTGSGKSVAINSMLMGLLYSKTPEELKLILIDPKRLELAPYNDIAHLLFPVATEPEKALSALKWLLQEMERRYALMAENGIRNLQEKNNLNLPYIVTIIDEFADLIMTSSKELENCVVRLAQMARAAGINLIIATQRPSVDVITGLIKANFPSRIAFRVSSKVDSRTIIDQSGAEDLLGNGDMLFLSNKGIVRLHGSFVSDDEVITVTNYIKSQGKADYKISNFQENL